MGTLLMMNWLFGFNADVKSVCFFDIKMCEALALGTVMLIHVVRTK